MQNDWLITGSEQASNVLVLAHGAGQGMDSVFMEQLAVETVAQAADILVVRFEFPYMKRIRTEGRHRPPDRQPVLEQAYEAVVTEIRQRLSPQKVVIGGKSIGGRIASMVAEKLQVDGVVCLGYPFHPPGKPERLRTAHLEQISVPVLICQGERDPFGTKAEVAQYQLSDCITLQWITDGEHSFKPRKSSGVTVEQNIQRAALGTAEFIKRL